MNFISCFLWAALAVSAVPALAAEKTPRQLIAEIPERSGGIYYAYPHEDDIMPEIPKGYEVAFISHYGRHGSRWIIKTWEYHESIAALDSAAQHNGLTPLGNDVLRRLRIIEAQARGNEGALSPKGEAQHRGIAERLLLRFPDVLNDSAQIEAYSSTEPRCIMSMAAFCERMKELKPGLAIKRHASPGDMAFISWSNPEIKAVNKPDSPWWKDLEDWRDSVLKPQRLMAALFTDPLGVENPTRLMWMLHDVAVDVQDVDPGVELLDIFTTDELYNLWQALNYKMYYLHGNNPATKAAGPRSARSLLNHIVADIDSAATGSRPHRAATLRFGHDTALLRLLALAKIEGATEVVDNPAEYADHWQDFALTPMAANLQIILLTSCEGKEPLIHIRHNERPAVLPIKNTHRYFYPWTAVRSLWKE